MSNQLVAESKRHGVQARHVETSPAPVPAGGAGRGAMVGLPRFLQGGLAPGPERPLDARTRAELEPRFGVSFDRVRVHDGPDADRSARTIGALAYTSGSDVVFANGRYAPTTPAGQNLLAHELTHVVQQRRGIDLPGGIGRPGDAYERHADLVAARIIRGESAAELLAPSAGSPTSDQVQRQTDAGVEASPPPTPSPYYTPAPADVANQVREEMQRPDPTAGVGDFHAAYALLNGLSMKDLLTTLGDLQSTHDLDLLAANFGSAAGLDQGRLQIAITVVLGPRASRAFPVDLAALASAVHDLPPEEINDFMTYLIQTNGTPNQQDLERLAQEGQQVQDQEAGPGATSLGPGMSSMAMVGMLGPGLWMPGNIPIGFYIGNAAHIGIAAYYTVSHLGEVVFTNFTSIASIVQQIAGMNQPAPSAPIYGPASTEQLNGNPDIANLTLHHIYEIKPEGSESLARAEAEWYRDTFLMNGIPMTLGPTTDPGVNGFFYNIGWYFIFDSPEPGVIVYRRRKAPPGPVLVPVPEPSEVPNEAPESSWRFSLPPLSHEQAKDIVVTTVVTAAAGVTIIEVLEFLGILALG